MQNKSNITRFSVSRSLAVTRRVLKQIVRDKRTFAMIIVMPVMIMVIFGFALSGEIKNTPVVVENLDQGFLNIEAGIEIEEFLISDDRIEVELEPYESGIKGVEKGIYSAAIQIPADFSSSLIAKSKGLNATLEILVYVDATKPIIRANILSTLQAALTVALGDQGVDIIETIAFEGSEQSGLDVAIPAVMAFVLTFLVMLISLITMVRETTTGTLTRLYTTPLTKTERLVGYVLALAFFGFIEVTAILAISILLFDAAVKGSLILLLVSAVFYALVNVLLSVFLSNFAENELQAVQMAPLVGLTSLALSGMLVPISSLPPEVQLLSIVIPMTYAVIIFEGVMLKGFSIIDLWVSYLALLLFLIVLLILSVATVKDHLKD